MPDTLQAVADHPAKWSKPVLTAIASMVHTEAEQVGRNLNILDPFAGVGRQRLDDAIHRFPDTVAFDHVVHGLELQPLWAASDAMTTQGDALAMPWPDATFDVAATSPCYGNRMADAHNARDDSVRNTYTHVLRAQGEEPAEGSSAVMNWGAEYRRFHEDFLVEVERVLAPGGLLLLNMSNHIRLGDEIRVVEWWLNVLIVKGWYLQEMRRVRTRRQRHGANRQARVDGEVVIAARPPADTGQERLL